VFSSVTGTALDEANVRKAFNRILSAAELDLRGPHQMRHTFASLLLQEGAPITYVSRQLGHKDGGAACWKRGESGHLVIWSSNPQINVQNDPMTQ
jgi:integrase